MLRITLKAKMLGTCLVLIFLSLILGTLILYTNLKVRQSFEVLSTIHFKSQVISSNIKANIVNIIANYRLLANENASDVMKVLETLQLSEKDTKINLENWTFLVKNHQDEFKNDNNNISKNLEMVKQIVAQISKTGKAMVVKIFDGHIEEGKKFADETDQQAKKLFSSVFKSITDDIDNEKRGILNFIDLIRLVSIFVLVIGIVASLIMVTVLIKYVSSNLNKLENGLNIAEGDLSNSSTELSVTAEGLSNGSKISTDKMTTVISSLEELSAQVITNTDNTQQAKILSEEGLSSAQNGAETMGHLLTAMEDISDSSKQIGDIIHIIDDIAFQTNLLALNAAVEAARAGEQGKGFAVVAEAVRNLAQKSASATKDVTRLINISASKVENGSKIAVENSDILNSIVDNVKKIATLNAEVSAASQEQKIGIQGINLALCQVEEVTKGNASHAEEVASTAQKMSLCSNDIQKWVNGLSALLYGQKNKYNLRRVT